MEWLNYHHLHYFWMVARERGLGPAAAKLRLSPPTLSAQIKALEAALGENLFEKQGRRLVLTERGLVAYRYAEEIFSLGAECVSAVRTGRSHRPLRLAVGVAQSVPKLVARRILAPLDRLATPVHLTCREEMPERLLSELAHHALDLVLIDAPGASTPNIKVFSHFLGKSPLAVFGTRKLAAAYGPGFPRSLDGAPFLLPTHASTVRRALEGWFDEVGVQPRVVAEFDDPALLNAFAEDGAGLFAAPSVIEDDIERKYRMTKLGTADGVDERFYVVTGSRRLTNPAVVAVTEAARGQLFQVTAAPGNRKRGTRPTRGHAKR